MAETGIERSEAPLAAQPPRQPRRLPALLRYCIIVLAGAALAGLTSYLLRTIGF
jgi:hypothetical protein